MNGYPVGTKCVVVVGDIHGYPLGSIVTAGPIVCLWWDGEYVPNGQGKMWMCGNPEYNGHKLQEVDRDRNGVSLLPVEYIRPIDDGITKDDVEVVRHYKQIGVPA